MKHRFTRPLALVHVVSVFREPGEIDDAEIGTDRRPGIRSRLTDVVPTGPDKHARNEIVLLDQLPCFLVRRAPWSTAVVVSRAGEVSVAILKRFIPFCWPAPNLVRRHVVTSASGKGRSCLRVDQAGGWETSGETCASPRARSLFPPGQDCPQLSKCCRLRQSCRQR